MSLALSAVSQMHDDVTVVAAYIPRDAVPENALRLFNFHLEAAREMYPDNPVLQKIHQATSQTPYHDLLVSVGQLQAALTQEEAAGR